MDKFIVKFPSLVAKILKYAKMTKASLLESNFCAAKDGRVPKIIY